jgi:hypothetical protein
VFKKRPSACTVLLFISIDYFIYLLEHFICIYSLGTQSSKLLIKSQHIQCTNQLTFNECGKKRGGGFEDTKKGNQNPYIEEEQTTQRKSTKGQTTIYKTYM